MSADMIAQLCSFQNATICYHAINPKAAKHLASPASRQSQTAEILDSKNAVVFAPTKYKQRVCRDPQQRPAPGVHTHLGLASVSGFWAERRGRGPGGRWTARPRRTQADSPARAAAVRPVGRLRPQPAPPRPRRSQPFLPPGNPVPPAGAPAGRARPPRSRRPQPCAPGQRPGAGPWGIRAGGRPEQEPGGKWVRARGKAGPGRPRRPRQ